MTGEPEGYVHRARRAAREAVDRFFSEHNSGDTTRKLRRVAEALQSVVFTYSRSPRLPEPSSDFRKASDHERAFFYRAADEMIDEFPELEPEPITGILDLEEPIGWKALPEDDLPPRSWSNDELATVIEIGSDFESDLVLQEVVRRLRREPSEPVPPPNLKVREGHDPEPADDLPPWAAKRLEDGTLIAKPGAGREPLSRRNRETDDSTDREKNDG